MKEIKCEIIQDLITLYVDDLTSEESKELIEEHIETCKECKEFLDNIKKDEGFEINDNKDNDLDVNEEVEVKLIKRIQKSKVNFSMIVILLTCAMTIALNDGPYVFAGIIILPAIGAITYLKLRNVWIAPVTIFLANIILAFGKDFNYIVEDINTNNYILERIRVFIQYIFGMAGYAMVFGFFTLIGVIIGILIEKIFIED